MNTMPRRPSHIGALWERLKSGVKTHTSLTLIIVAALLLELSTGVMYYSAQNMIQRAVDRMVQREMNALYLCIRNKLTKVEVTVDNMSWVITDDLHEPDSLLRATRQIVEHNPLILGSSISCVPYYYPEKGRWFEPYSVRKPDGTIETMQLGSKDHDYTTSEFFTRPIINDKGHWCEPYVDSDGAKAKVTTYGVPVHDKKGIIAAVVDADISLDWLEDVANESKIYNTTLRFIVTGKYNLLAGEDNALLKQILEHIKSDPDKKGSVILEDEKGHSKHVYYTPVGGMTDWLIINALDDNDLYRKLRNIRISLLSPMMIGLLFIGFIVYRSSSNLERLRKVNAEKERIGGELHVASEIQQSMLPQGKMKNDSVEVRGFLKPVREVGGDLYDYFVRDEKMFFCIGDVSGKGTPAAMLMAVAHTKFRDFSIHENNPARIMQKINETTSEGNETNMFVTLFIGVLDLPTGRLRYCNAGHDKPVIIGRETLPAVPNLPVGLFADFKYELQETQLDSGSTLFLYTDGLTEAKNTQHEMFGLKRVMPLLDASTDLMPAQLLKKMRDEVTTYVGDAEQSDDLTMLAIRYTPKQFDTMLDETFVMNNDIKEVARFSEFIKEATGKMGIEKSLANQLRLAAEEAIVNVIDYAYPPGTEGHIEVRMMYDGTTLRFKIIDSGVAFDPTAKEKADTTLSAEDRQIGGLGILLVRELMDSINYERNNGKNILTLIKDINGNDNGNGNTRQGDHEARTDVAPAGRHSDSGSIKSVGEANDNGNGNDNNQSI